MQPLNLEYLCRVANEIAVQAAAKIIEVYNSDFAIEHKDDKSPLTQADMAAHHIIVEGLTALTPDIPVLSEESASIPYAHRKTWDRYWLVDPLDGTREFIALSDGAQQLSIEAFGQLMKELQPLLAAVGRE